MSLPQSLNGTSPAGLISNEPIAQFEIGPLKNFVYLLIDWKTRECAIVDPQTDLKPLRQAMDQHGLKPAGILLTHTHHDHVGGLGELVQLFPKIPVYVHEGDLHRINGTVRSAANLRLIQDGDLIRVGDLAVQVLHTPGHSPGECCYFFTVGSTPYLFTGDTVFIRDCGRTDFAGGSTVEMFDSLQRIKTLPEGTVILCGHHYKPECASTLAVEMVDSPPFRCRTVAELEALP